MTMLASSVVSFLRSLEEDDSLIRETGTEFAFTRRQVFNAVIKKFYKLNKKSKVLCCSKMAFGQENLRH